MEAKLFPHNTDPEPGPTMDRLVRDANMYRARSGAEDASIVGAVRGFDTGVFIGPAILFAITAGYIWLEIHWQLDLLHLVNSAKSTRDDIDFLVLEGRGLAAFGLVWAVLKTKFLKSSVESMSSMVSTFALVGGATILAFSLIGRLYDGVIDELPANTSLQLYKVAAHRQWSLNGDLPTDASSKDPVAVLLWPLKMADATQAPGIEAVFDKRAEGFKAGAEDEARKLWPQVKDKLAQTGNPGELSSKFDALYEKYISGASQVKSVVSSWETARSNYFQSLTGIKPNAGANKEEFAKALQGAKISQMQQLGQLYLDTKGFTLDPVVHQSGDVIFYASDFSGVRNESEFTRVVINKVAGGMAAMVPTLETVKTHAESSSVVSSAIVPPISMTLSMISILVNFGALMGLLCVRMPVLRYLQTVIPIFITVGIFLAVNPTTSLPGLEGGMTWLRGEYPWVSWILERIVTLEHFAIAIF